MISHITLKILELVKREYQGCDTVFLRDVISFINHLNFK